MRRDISTAVASASGLDPADRQTVLGLVETYLQKLPRNELRRDFYLGHRRARDLGISTPPKLRDLEQSCGWPAKAVNSLADRSQFDGFVCDDEGAAEELRQVVAENGLKRAYRQAVKSELTYCCSFLTVTAGDASLGEPPAVVSCYEARSASALWDEAGRALRAGMVVVGRDRRPNMGDEPTWVDVFTADAVIRIRRAPGVSDWRAEYLRHSMGRPLIEPMAHDASLDRPFGRSRITREVMGLADDAQRGSRRAEIAAEFATSAQKYLLGADREALGDQSKWDAYVGSIFAVSKDADGDVPQFGQLQQPSMQPHIDYMRSLAARFSAATNVPLSELGVVTDNPSSAEAIYAAKEALVIDAQNLNADNGRALENVARMALAVRRGTDFSAQSGGVVTARFRNPAMPSLVSQADAILKIVQAIPWLAESDVTLEELGFADDQMQRMRSDRRRAQGAALVASVAPQGAGARDAGAAQG